MARSPVGRVPPPVLSEHLPNGQVQAPDQRVEAPAALTNPVGTQRACGDHLRFADLDRQLHLHSVVDHP